jgi:hypothetical protein
LTIARQERFETVDLSGIDIEGSQMEVKAPEAGPSIDRDLVPIHECDDPIAHWVSD